jgi:hypothetical protein
MRNAMKDDGHEGQNAPQILLHRQFILQVDEKEDVLLFRPMFSVSQAKGSAFHDDMLGRTGNRRFTRVALGAARNKLAARLSTESLYVYNRVHIYVK